MPLFNISLAWLASIKLRVAASLKQTFSKTHVNYNGSIVYAVTTTADHGHGSLRQVIEIINQNKSCEISTIFFDIPSKCEHVIYIKSSLPSIQYPVEFKGEIELNGKFANSVGLTLADNASCSIISGIKFRQFQTDIGLNNVGCVQINCNDFSSSFMNQSSIVGNSVSNLSVTYNKFKPTATDSNGISLTNPSGAITFENNVFEGFSDTTSASNGNAIYVLLNNGQTLDTLNVVCNKFDNISNPFAGQGGNGVFVDFEGSGGILTNFNVGSNVFTNISGTLSNIFLGGNGILINSNASGSEITNFKLIKNNFDTVTAGANAVVVVLNATNTSISEIISVNNIFNNFDEESDEVFVCAFLLGLNASGAYIGTFKDSCSTYTNFLNGAQAIIPYLIVDDCSIDNIIVDGSKFNNFTSGTIAVYLVLAGDNTVSNLNIFNCTFDNFNLTTSLYSETFGIYAYVLGTLTNYNVTNCKFTNFSGLGVGDVSLNFAILAETGDQGQTTLTSIDNFKVDKCSFKNFSNGLAIATNADIGTIANTCVSKCKFDTTSSPIVPGSTGFIAFVPSGGNQTNTTVTECEFNNISSTSNAIEIFSFSPASVFDKVVMSKNTFKNITGTSQGIISDLISGPLTINNWDITDNKFIDIADISNGILIPTTGGVISNMNVSYNEFTGPNATTDGYAASITIDAGDTTCLKFTNNKANPKCSPIPYVLTNTNAGGIFNLTKGSDSSTNIGKISLVGSIGNPGSCSLCPI